MTNDALEIMEAEGVVTAKKDECRHRRCWAITLLLSISVMAISLLIFCLTGKTNNMEISTATIVITFGTYFTILYTALGVVAMWGGYDSPPPLDSPPEIGPADRAKLEQIFVVLICLVTLGSGKIVEVFLYTMSLVIGFIAISQLLSPTVDHDDFEIKDLWFIIGLGTVTGFVCLIPKLFFFLGWFSIFICSYVFIFRYNFPDKTLVEAFSMVAEDLDLR